MSIIQGIIAVLNDVFGKETTGFVPDSFDPRDAWHDLVFGTVDPASLKPTIDWSSSINLRRQGIWPFCVSFAAAHLYNFITGKDISVRWLASKSNTTSRGTSIRTVLEILRTQGAVLEEELPFDFNTPLFRWSDVLSLRTLTAQQIGNANQRKIDGYARIDAKDTLTMKAALQHGPVLIAIGIAPNYSWGGVIEYPKAISLYHCILITGYDENGNWRIGDSLVPQSKLLSKRYDIPWAYTITPLPDGWKEKQVEVLYSSYDRLLKERFGKPRDYANEVAEANLLAKLIVPYVKKTPALGGVFGKYWICYTASIVYGGWVFQDILDDAMNVVRTGKHLYDFNDVKD